MDHFNIAKVHIFQHASEVVKALGAMDGLSTETMETLHIISKHVEADD